jgi:D-alanyl-D-alanine carboxypeptidase-like protein
VPDSQNGYPANRRDLVSSRFVPGTGVRLTVRNGPAGDLLLEVAALFDRLVQDIDSGVVDDWGYAERPIRGSAVISNHASGTAIDLNATRWALGSSPSVNLDPARIDTVRRIVRATGGVVRWGGDYTGRKDPMHFEINDNRSEADCARALDQLRAAFGAALRPTSPPRPREDDPMAIIPIRVDAAGRFHETAMVEAGGTSGYGERAAITMGSTWGWTTVAVTALNHQAAPLFQWSAQIADNGFWAAELPGDARIVTIEGTVQVPADVPGADGSLAQKATRPAAAVHTRARA